MVNERENTEWHREENVGVHTNMLIDFYLDNFYDQRSHRQRIHTLVACLFHDVAKPPSRITVERDGVNRNAYHGHELRSARMWADYAVRNVDSVLKLDLDIRDVSNIAFMIEHHVPFGLKKPKKKEALKTAFYARMGDTGHQAWVDLLLCDQNGRHSDKKAANLETCHAWLDDWCKVTVNA